MQLATRSEKNMHSCNIRSLCHFLQSWKQNIFSKSVATGSSQMVLKIYMSKFVKNIQIFWSPSSTPIPCAFKVKPMSNPISNPDPSRFRRRNSMSLFVAKKQITKRIQFDGHVSTSTILSSTCDFSVLIKSRHKTYGKQSVGM